MSAPGSRSDRPRASDLLDCLLELGATHVVGLPDNASAPLWARLQDEGRIRAVAVTREGEAFAVAAGLWMGGAHPVVSVQNTGLLEAGDALRGTAMRMGMPLPLLLTMRGFAKLDAAGLDPVSPPAADVWPRALLVRSDVDSVALLTEPTLQAWGIPWKRLADDDLSPVRQAWDLSHREERPVAVLIIRGLR